MSDYRIVHPHHGQHPVVAQDVAQWQQAATTDFADVDLAPFIDHTLLRPDATRKAVMQLCAEAKEHGFASVCANSVHVALCAEALIDSPVKVVSVVGFPFGASGTSSKVFEARQARHEGAHEVDMVVDLGALKESDHARVLEDIARVVWAVAPMPVKVILEIVTLSHEQKLIGCALAQAAGAAYVKTSTGFAAGGATVEDVALMRSVVGEMVGVKASGGIRTAADARRMLQAGATRLGCSASVAMVSGAAAS